MQIVVNIPEKVVRAIQNGQDYRYDIHTAIAQGIPLPKEHGDLIDREALKDVLWWATDGVWEGINTAKTVIPADSSEED